MDGTRYPASKEFTWLLSAEKLSGFAVPDLHPVRALTGAN